MPSNLLPVAFDDIPAALSESQLPVILMYWNPKDPQYADQQWHDHAASFADKYAGQVKVFTVEMTPRQAENAHYRGQTLFSLTKGKLPTLQVIKQDVERTPDCPWRPGFSDGRNFLPSMRLMFELAAKKPYVGDS